MKMPASKSASAQMSEHDLFRHIQKRVRLGWNWEPIADELGCAPADLVEWVNEYKSPPRKPMVRAGQPIYGSVKDLPKNRPQEKAAQFIAWRRAQEGARKAREAVDL